MFCIFVYNLVLNIMVDKSMDYSQLLLNLVKDFVWPTDYMFKFIIPFEPESLNKVKSLFSKDAKITQDGLHFTDPQSGKTLAIPMAQEAPPVGGKKFPKKPGQINVNQLDLTDAQKKNVLKRANKGDFKSLSNKEFMELADFLGVDTTVLTDQEKLKIMLKFYSERDSQFFTENYFRTVSGK